MLNHCLGLKIKCSKANSKKQLQSRKKTPCSVCGKNEQEYQTKKRDDFQMQESEEYTPRYGKISISNPRERLSGRALLPNAHARTFVSPYA